MFESHQIQFLTEAFARGNHNRRSPINQSINPNIIVRPKVEILNIAVKRGHHRRKRKREEW